MKSFLAHMNSPKYEVIVNSFRDNTNELSNILVNIFSACRKAICISKLNQLPGILALYYNDQVKYAKRLHYYGKSMLLQALSQ